MYKSMIKECISKFPDDSKNVFTEIAEYAVFLGYTPKWVKVRVDGKAVNGDSLTFTKAKVKRTLLKIRKGQITRIYLYLSRRQESISMRRCLN